MMRRLWPSIRMLPGWVTHIVCATTTTLAFGGHRARSMMSLTAAAMVSGATRLVSLRCRSGYRNLCIATVAETTEKREWANPARFFGVSFAQSTRHFHLIAALLANPLIASKSSTPHTEPAVDGRSLRATTFAVLLLRNQSEDESAGTVILNSFVEIRTELQSMSMSIMMSIQI
jgi:hypothetical protein